MKTKEIEVIVNFASGNKEKFTETTAKFFERNPDAGEREKEAS